MFGKGGPESFVKALAGGVRIAMGSDSSILPHGENAKEIVWMASNGMTPIQALRAATIDAAELLGWKDRIGSIAPGKIPDPVGVRGDALEEHTAVRHGV